MKKLFRLFLCTAAALFLCQCACNSTESGGSTKRELTAAEKTLIASDNIFGLKLFREIVREEGDTNIFVSPLSVSMALGMAYNGADGDTRQVMQQVLELSGMTLQEVNESYQSLIKLLTGLDPKVKFEIANSIWPREGFPVEDEFIDLNQTYFDAVVQVLDFNQANAADIINSWVDEKTHGKITKIVQAPINPLTVMFLINAIYFKGDWTYEFDKKDTRQDLFNLPDGSSEKYMMMTQRGDFQYFENELFQAVDLSYGNGDFSMTIFLPKENDIFSDVDSLAAKFNQENWNIWLTSFSEHDVDLFMPRFELEYEIELNDALKVLGMEIAFVPFEADFTNISDTDDLYISNVKHKTFVRVDEEGTEAAAVTVIEFGATSAPVDEIVMYINRPFIFAIRDHHSSTILFIGKIINPGMLE